MSDREMTPQEWADWNMRAMTEAMESPEITKLRKDNASLRAVLEDLVGSTPYGGMWERARADARQLINQSQPVKRDER